MNKSVFDLPFPPSTNTFWRHVGQKTLLSAKGRRYKAEVYARALEQHGPFGPPYRASGGKSAVDLNQQVI